MWMAIKKYVNIFHKQKRILDLFHKKGKDLTPSYRCKKSLHLFTSIRSFPLLRSMCKNHPSFMRCDLPMLTRFTIMFASSFTMGKAHPQVRDILKMWEPHSTTTLSQASFFGTAPTLGLYRTLKVHKSIELSIKSTLCVFQGSLYFGSLQTPHSFRQKPLVTK